MRLKKKKPKLTTLPHLIKRADAAFSKYVRLRDAEFKGGQWIGECISCGRKMVVVDADGNWVQGIQAGHYISRGHKELRWDEVNVNAQCFRCNMYIDKGDMLRAYRKALCLKVGESAVEDVELRANTSFRPTREYLSEIIHNSKEYVAFTLANPEGLKKAV